MHFPDFATMREDHFKAYLTDYQSSTIALDKIKTEIIRQSNRTHDLGSIAHLSRYARLVRQHYALWHGRGRSYVHRPIRRTIMHL